MLILLAIVVVSILVYRAYQADVSFRAFNILQIAKSVVV